MIRGLLLAVALWVGYEAARLNYYVNREERS